MKIIRDKKTLQQTCLELKRSGKRIGFVPTMGALHKGHLSLVGIAQQHSDLVIASIFINPAQFAAHEDLDTYPRTEEADLAALKSKNVDIVYMPQVEDIYPEGFDLSISTGKLGQDLDGGPRPHFFDGVALVVTKLFMQTMPDVAVFGEKDFQQLTIIRLLALQLDMPIDIVGGETIREDDGLAFSSRNRYLTKNERKDSVNLSLQIKQCMKLLNNGISVNKASQETTANLLKLGFDKVDYIAIRDNGTLAEVTEIKQNKQYRILAAATIGKTRLIDNMLYEPK